MTTHDQTLQEACKHKYIQLRKEGGHFCSVCNLEFIAWNDKPSPLWLEAKRKEEIITRYYEGEEIESLGLPKDTKQSCQNACKLEDAPCRNANHPDWICPYSCHNQKEECCERKYSLSRNRQWVLDSSCPCHKTEENNTYPKETTILAKRFRWCKPPECQPAHKEEVKIKPEHPFCEFCGVTTDLFDYCCQMWKEKYIKPAPKECEHEWKTQIPGKCGTTWEYCKKCGVVLNSQNMVIYEKPVEYVTQEEASKFKKEVFDWLNEQLEDLKRRFL